MTPSRDKTSNDEVLIFTYILFHRELISKDPFTQAIFVEPKLQLQNRTRKPGSIFSAICRRDIAGVSNMFEVVATLGRQKFQRAAATKIKSLFLLRECEKVKLSSFGYSFRKDGFNILTQFPVFNGKTENYVRVALWFLVQVDRVQLSFCK